MPVNIFVVNVDPVRAARALCDSHVVKMPLETTQILSTVVRTQGICRGYNITHQRHPCVLWAGDSLGNFNWTLAHGLALCEEYSFRYGRTHACKEVLLELGEVIGKLHFFYVRRQPFVMVPSEYSTGNTINDYRAYYRREKWSIAEWRHGRLPPKWWEKGRFRGNKVPNL